MQSQTSCWQVQLFLTFQLFHEIFVLCTTQVKEMIENWSRCKIFRLLISALRFKQHRRFVSRHSTLLSFHKHEGKFAKSKKERKLNWLVISSEDSEIIYRSNRQIGRRSSIHDIDIVQECCFAGCQPIVTQYFQEDVSGNSVRPNFG